VVCDERGIGCSGEYFGDNDAHLGRINVLYHEASGAKYMPSAFLFDLEPVMMPLGELLSLGNLVNHTRGKNWAKDLYKKG
jgi:hypothetical protein